MKIAKAAAKLSLHELTSVHEMIVDVTGDARALCGTALFSIASLVYFELEQVLILVAVLVTVYSILTMSMQEIHITPSSSVVDNLVSAMHEKRRKLVLAGIKGLAGVAEQKTSDAKSWWPVVRFVNDDISKSKPSPTQVCTFSSSDPVSVLLGDTIVKKETAQEESTVIAIPKHGLAPTIGIKTRSIEKNVLRVSKGSLLPKNVLKTTTTGKAAVATFPVTKATTATKTVLKRNVFKKAFRAFKKAFNAFKTFKGEGVISFIHHNRKWGRIRLDTATKWCETQVFFHRDHLSGVAASTPLFIGQSVKLKYSYRRNNNGKQDSLRASSVKLTTTGEKKWRSAVVPLCTLRKDTLSMPIVDFASVGVRDGHNQKI